jgi:hypothetical protein
MYEVSPAFTDSQTVSRVDESGFQGIGSLWPLGVCRTAWFVKTGSVPTIAFMLRAAGQHFDLEVKRVETFKQFGPFELCLPCLSPTCLIKSNADARSNSEAKDKTAP